jgi:hypothetical protein
MSKSNTKLTPPDDAEAEEEDALAVDEATGEAASFSADQ